jgi:hypothetical protein
MNHPQRQLSDWRRVVRVFSYLLARPQDIPSYFRYAAFTRKTPLDLGMPWWSFGAVKRLDAILRPDFEVFEYGSGGSTIFMASRVRSVTCVEDENEWTALVSKAAESRKLGNISILQKSFDFWQTGTFASSDYLLSLSGKSYDVIVVDGKEWSDQVRDVCFWRAEDHIKKGGVIVLDDSWRYPQVKKKNRALNWKEYKGTGFCRVGVTSTTVFQY